MNTLITFFQHFIASLVSGQLPQLGYWTYILLAVLVAVEGPIATLLGAAAASVGLMEPVPVFFAAAAGNLTADMLWYYLGYIGKIEWLYRFGHRLGINRSHLERLQKSMREHTTKILFFAKLTVSFVIPSLVAAGLVKAPWRKWFPAIFTAEMIWTGALVIIGYYTTEAIKRVEQGMEYIILAVSAIFILFLLFWARRVLKDNNDDNTESGSDNNSG